MDSEFQFMAAHLQGDGGQMEQMERTAIGGVSIKNKFVAWRDFS